MDDSDTPRRSFWSTCFPTRAAIGLALLVCVVVPVLLIALQTAQNPKFSPIDEPAHWDYVKRVAGGSVPRMGQNLKPSTLREIACRKVDLAGLLLPKCGTATLRTSSFPGRAQQYEAQQPPTYYALTVPVRWIGHDVFGASDVGATRAAGYLWLPLGLLTLWCAGLVLGISASRMAAGVLLIATAPLAIYSSSVVSNDVPAIFAGGLVALVAALAYRRPGRWVAPVLAGTAFFVVSIKTTNLFAVVAVAALFALHQLVGRERHTSMVALLRSWLADGGSLLLGGAAAALIWVVVNRGLALVNPRDLAVFTVLRTHPVTPALILREATTLLGPLTDSFVSGTLNNNLQQTLQTLLKYLLLGAGLSGLFVAPRRWPHALGLIALVTLLAGGFVFGAGLRLNYSIDPGLSGRYGLSVVPLLILALAAGVRGRWTERGIWVFGGLMLTVNVFALVA